MFDSGFGGLTVARALIDLLPAEDLVYVGDTGRYPYGPRPLDEVRAFAHQITEHLVDDHDVKLVVVACNTASAAAARRAAGASRRCRSSGSSSPACASLVSATRNGHVGVIGTVGTIGSGAYQRAVAAADPGVEAGLRRLPRLRRVRRAGRDRLRPGARAGRAAAGAVASTPRSTRCCWAAPTTRTWPARSATSWAATSCWCLRRRDRVRGAPTCSATSTWVARSTGTGRAPPLRCPPATSSVPSPRPPAARARARRRARPWRGTDRHGPRLLGELPGAGRRLQRLPGAATAAPTWRSTSGRGRWPTSSSHLGLDELDARRAQPLPPRPLGRPHRPRTSPEVPVRLRGPAGVRHGREPGHGRLLVTGQLEPTFDWRGHRRRRRVRRRAGCGFRSRPHRPLRRDPRGAGRRRRLVVRLLRRHRAGLVARARSGAASTWPCARPPTAPTRRPRGSSTSPRARPGEMAAGGGGEAAGAHPHLARGRRPSAVQRPSSGRGRLRCARSTIASPQREVHPVRPDGRAPDELRDRSPSSATSPTPPPGSVLVTFGRTKVLCTAYVDEDVPRWMRGSGKGWVTAEYSMLPGASPERIRREVPRAPSRAAPRRSSASSGARCAPCATWRRSASARSSSTATCSRPTAAPAPRRSPAATSPCTTP